MPQWKDVRIGMVQFLLSSSVAFQLFWAIASFIVLLLPFIFPFSVTFEFFPWHSFP